MRVRFTKHANLKFEILRKRGLEIKRSFVAKTVREPELEDNESREPLKIAVSRLDGGHYLRVIYKQEGGVRNRKGRYEGKL